MFCSHIVAGQSQRLSHDGKRGTATNCDDEKAVHTSCANSLWGSPVSPLVLSSSQSGLRPVPAAYPASLWRTQIDQFIYIRQPVSPEVMAHCWKWYTPHTLFICHLFVWGGFHSAQLHKGLFVETSSFSFFFAVLLQTSLLTG